MDLNVSQIANRVYLLVDQQMPVTEIRVFLDQQYRMLLNSHQWSFVKANGAIATVAERKTGTVSIINGSAAVVGTGTAFAAGDVNSMMVLAGVPYIISAVTNTTNLTLSSVYAGTTNTAATYVIRTHRYNLATNIESIISQSGTEWALYETTETTLNQIDPNRRVTGLPRCFTYVAQTTTGVTRVELWPVPTETLNLPYMGLTRSSLTTSSQTISDISDVLLKAGAEMTCQALFAKTSDKRWLLLGQLYGTQYREGLVELKRRDMRRFGMDEERRIFRS